MTMSIQELAGCTLGTRTVRYDWRDAALYALAVGARADQLELVYERDLRPLPTYATALGMWGTEAAAKAGGYRPADVLHARQTLQILEPLEPQAELDTAAHVAAVYDKGEAAIVDVRVESAHFVASYQMYVKGAGGWGGQRGPARSDPTSTELEPASSFFVEQRAAALYRLTGDLHPVHIDPELARGTGLRGPILHGLCTLGIAAREVAESQGRSALDVRSLEASLRMPVYPGDTLDVATNGASPATGIGFDASVNGDSVLTGFVELSPAGGANR